MVHNPKHGLPNKQHLTEDSAVEEAMRLASKHSGDPIFVLEAVGGFATEPPQPVHFKLEYLPIPDDQS